ncbi:MAG: hypothetical protein R3C68_01670 [Myxococcota bacterium]
MTRRHSGTFGRLALVCIALCSSCGWNRIEHGTKVQPIDVYPEVPQGAFFVSPVGDDARDGLSPQTAWATFAHAWTLIGAGDTLVLEDGVYTEPLDVPISGLRTLPVTIMAHHSGGAIIDGTGVHIPCSQWQ